jgi:glycosyltransferase involved in cell wall biosynthesis
MAAAPDLVLVGRGSLPATLVDLIAELGLTGRIRVHADVERTELLQLYREASVFVQTSHEEGLGIAVLEAMACGLPVVATDTAGSRETVVDGVTGWRVPSENVTSTVADRVTAILRDPDCRMGAAGRRRCEARFSSAAALDRYVDVYEAVSRIGAA